MCARDVRWRLPAALVALAIVAFAGCAGPGRPAAPAVDEAAIAAAVDSFIAVHNAAITARDTDGVVALYTDDASILPAGAPRVDGADAIRGLWRGSLSLPGMGMTLASQRKIVSQGGDMVADIGTYDFHMLGSRGDTLRDAGKYVTVMKKVDGHWKMVVDTWNSDPPPGRVK